MEYNREVLQCNTFTRDVFYNTFLRKKIELFANDLLRIVLAVIFSLALMNATVAQIRTSLGLTLPVSLISLYRDSFFLISLALDFLLYLVVIFIQYLSLYWIFSVINKIIMHFYRKKYRKKGIDEYAHLITDDFNKNIHPNLSNFVKNIESCYSRNKDEIEKYKTMESKLFVNTAFNQISVCITSLNGVVLPVSSFSNDSASANANKKIMKELNRVLLYELISCVVASLEQMSFDETDENTKLIALEKKRLYETYIRFQNNLSSQLNNVA